MPGSYVAEPQGKRGGKDICVDACVGGIVICGSDIVKFCKKGGLLEILGYNVEKMSPKEAYLKYADG